MNNVENVIVKGLNCVKLESDKYFAIVAPDIGSSVLRLYDRENEIDVFRYSEDVSAEQIKREIYLWGLPSLYLPNRFDAGILKTSDAVYHFPINEPDLNNFIHGFVQNRAFEVEQTGRGDGKAFVKVSFNYGEDDEMFECFPVKFKLSYIFTLSDDGLVQEFELTNLCDKMLPVSLCTHTCISSPMGEKYAEDKGRIKIAIGKKCELNERCLPTERLLDLTDYDMQYQNGTMMPTLQNIDNDMYTVELNELDGKAFNGIVMTDTVSGKRVCNEISSEFKFWNVWNCKGVCHFYCPEPMTAMINSANLSLPNEVTGYSEISNGQTYKCWQRFFTI